MTPEDIRAAAAAVFRPDNRLVLTYLPQDESADAGAASSETEAVA